jgi:hypothetical protein
LLRLNQVDINQLHQIGLLPPVVVTFLWVLNNKRKKNQSLAKSKQPKTKKQRQSHPFSISWTPNINPPVVLRRILLRATLNKPCPLAVWTLDQRQTCFFTK